MITSHPASRHTAAIVRVEGARVEVRVPVGPGAERITRVVGVHQIDASGDRR